MRDKPDATMTCEQRRAIEYGIDVTPQDSREHNARLVREHKQYDPEASPNTRTPQPLSSVIEPRPNGRDYGCPITYATAYRRWERSHAPRRRPVDYDVLPWKEQTRAAFDGEGEGENR